MLVRSIVILVLSVGNLLAIPRGSSNEELQRLARLPRVEFPRPLEFQRREGFRIFPDREEQQKEAVRILKEAAITPSEAPQLLKAARLVEQSRGLAHALKTYRQAARLFRELVEIKPTDTEALIGLADSLNVLGSFSEAESTLGRALSASPESAECYRALGRHHEERAWRAFVGEAHLFSRGGVVTVVRQTMKEPLSFEQLEETEKRLALSSAAFDRAVELDPEDAEVRFERAAFRSLNNVILAAVASLQAEEGLSGNLWSELLTRGALEDLEQAAKLGEDCERIGAAAMFLAFQSWGRFAEAAGTVSPLQLDWTARLAMRPHLNRLRVLADSDNLKMSATANEVLGCLQFYLLRDWEGGERSLRKVLAFDPERSRAWDMLLLCVNRGADAGELVKVCEELTSQRRNARNQVLLAKGWDLAGEKRRAELAVLEALTLNANDFLANLSLAALLLKDENASDYMWQIRQCLERAERHMGVEPPIIQQVDLAFTKVIFHALNGEMGKARQAFDGLPASSRQTAEVQELTRLLEQ